MEEGKERKEKYMVVSSPPPPSPLKPLVEGSKENKLKPPNSSSCNQTVRSLRNPSLSICKVCDTRCKPRDRLQFLYGPTRVVILCKACHNNVQSSKVCSYCFEQLFDVGVVCRSCKHHVHHSCSTKYTGFNLRPDKESFCCIDCWIPNQRKRNANASADVGSRKKPRVASDVGPPPNVIASVDACPANTSSDVGASNVIVSVDACSPDIFRQPSSVGAPDVVVSADACVANISRTSSDLQVPNAVVPANPCAAKIPRASSEFRVPNVAASTDGCSTNISRASSDLRVPNAVASTDCCSTKISRTSSDVEKHNLIVPSDACSAKIFKVPSDVRVPNAAASADGSSTKISRASFDVGTHNLIVPSDGCSAKIFKAPSDVVEANAVASTDGSSTKISGVSFDVGTSNLVVPADGCSAKISRASSDVVEPNLIASLNACSTKICKVSSKVGAPNVIASVDACSAKISRAFSDNGTSIVIALPSACSAKISIGSSDVVATNLIVSADTCSAKISRASYEVEASEDATKDVDLKAEMQTSAVVKTKEKVAKKAEVAKQAAEKASPDVGALENAAKEADLKAEMKISAAVKAKEKAAKKAELAKQAAEKAANAVDFAVVVAKEETQVKGSNNLVIADAELAFRLHRAINSSPRIAKNLSSIKLQASKCNNYSIAWHSEPTNSMVCADFEVCNGSKIIETNDKVVLEPTVHIDTLQNGSFLEPRMKVDMTVNAVQCKRSGADGVKLTYKRRLKAGSVKNSDCIDSTVGFPVKEEQGSCSNVVSSSTGVSGCLNSGAQSAFHEDSTIMIEKESRLAVNKFQKKYSRRWRGTDKCLKMYSRRRTNVKQILDKNSMFPVEDTPLDIWALTSGLPSLQMNGPQMSTFYCTSSLSHSVPPTSTISPVPASSSGPFQP